MKKLLLDRLESEIGPILMVVDPDNGKVCAIDYSDYEARMHKLLGRHFPEFGLEEADNPYGYSNLLRAYFKGDFKALNTIEVSTGGTLFQQEVWKLLRTIPVGTTTTYGELALKLSKPGAARAVGLANSLNPVAIVIPCHRVIGANTSLTGYAGGLERKRWLLTHESPKLEQTAPAQLSLWL